MTSVDSAAESVPPAPAAVSEADLELLHALQVHPRAPWTLVGRALGVAPATAARRWRRLSDAGLAWVTGYRPDLAARSGEPVHGYVTMRCLPARVRAAAEELAGHDEVLSVETVAGDADLFATVAAADRGAFADYLTGRLAAVGGLLSTSTSFVTRLHVEGSRWRLRALAPDRARLLRADVGRRPPAAVPARGTEPDAVDARLIAALARDGRAAFAALGAAAGVSEPTARRRVARLVDGARLALRCDVAWEAAGWPVTHHLALRLPPAAAVDAARVLAALPETRLVASCVGDADLVAGLWLAELADAHRVESHLAERVREAAVVRRMTGLRTFKRMGRLLDPAGRAVRAGPGPPPDFVREVPPSPKPRHPTRGPGG